MVVLGYEIGSKRGIDLSAAARRQGVYVIGTTGTGKTTLLKNIAYQDMVAGEGLCVLDPHGDMIDELLELVPANREQDVILFAPGDDDQAEQPLGLNVFDCNRSDPRQVRRVTSTVIDTLRKLFFYSWGPRMEDLLRSSILTLMETDDTTLLDLWLLLASPQHRKRYTKEDPQTEQSSLQDAYLRQFWDVQFRGYTKSPRDLIELVGSSLNKIGRFLADPHMRRIVAQPRSAFNMREVMDQRKILLVNLSKGDLGEDNSALLGAVLVNLILIAALTRRDTLSEERIPFHMIVDEYQSFATESFPTLQSEARKYGIDVVVAHQYRDQLDDLNKGSTLNVANFVVLQTSGIDAAHLALQFDNTPPAPDTVWETMRIPSERFDGYYQRGELDKPVPGQRRTYSDMQAERANQLSGLDVLQAQCRLIVDRKLKKYIIDIPFLTEPGDPERARAIRNNSLTLGMPRAEVEDLIETRIGQGLTFDDVRTVVEDTYE